MGNIAQNLLDTAAREGCRPALRMGDAALTYDQLIDAVGAGRGGTGGARRHAGRPRGHGAAERAVLPRRLLRRADGWGSRGPDEPVAQGAGDPLQPAGFGGPARRRRGDLGTGRSRGRGRGRYRGRDRGRRPAGRTHGRPCDGEPDCPERRRRGGDPLHLRDHRPAERRRTHPRKPVGERPHHRADAARHDAGRRRHGLPAAVPRLRAHLRAQRVGAVRRQPRRCFRTSTRRPSCRSSSGTRPQSSRASRRCTRGCCTRPTRTPSTSPA